MPFNVGEMTEAEMVVALRDWKNLSDIVSFGRAEENNEPANAALREKMAQEDDLLTPFAIFWLAGNYASHGRFDEAVEVYRELGERCGDRRFGGRSWGSRALEGVATTLDEAGHWEEALTAWSEHIDLYTEELPRGQVLARMAYICERNDRRENAHELYTQIASLEEAELDRGHVPPEHLRMHARARMATISQGAPWARADLEELAAEVVTTLASQDWAALRQLLNPEACTFSIAPGEPICLRRDEFMEILVSELTGSEIRAVGEDEHDPESAKAYVEITGLDGPTFRGNAHLQFVRGIEGWTWAGGVFWGIRDIKGAERYTSYPTDHPLSNLPDEGLQGLKIKAPWSSGYHFRAGGIWWSIPVAATFFGAIIAHLESRCGFGIMGFFYGQGGHTDSMHYAVDFMRFPGVYTPSSLHEEVLSIAEGIVESVDGSYTRGDGDPWHYNFVNVRHSPWKQGEAAVVAIAAFINYLAGNPTPMEEYRKAFRYCSHYVHLDGPKKIPVMVGQWAQQGRVLGYMDDTGLSVFDHLHFSIHDRENGEKSVKPSPLDGQDLHPVIHDGRCCSSTNVPKRT